MVCAVLFAPTLGAAQQTDTPLRSPVLTIDTDRLFRESLFGQRMAQELEAAQASLAQENKAIEGELADEERALVDLREDMNPADFKAAADAFDLRVQGIRNIQDNKADAIVERREAAEQGFITAARPVLALIMRQAGAVAILERRSVLLSTDVIDVTDLAIERLNTAVGEGISPPVQD